MYYLILILLITPQPVTPVFPLIVTAVTAAYTAYSVLNEAHDTYTKATTKSTDDIYESVADLSSSLDHAEQRINANMNDIYNKLITELPRIIERNAALRDLAKKIARINHWYRKFEKLYRHKKRKGRKKAQGFARLATSDRPGHLLDILNEIKEDVLPEGTKDLRTGVMELITEGNASSTKKSGIKNERWPCDVRFGKHGPAYPLYKLLLMAEMKATIMVGLSFVMLGHHKNENYIPEVEYEQENMIERTQAYMEGLSKSETVKQRTTRACEPGFQYKSLFHFNEFMGLKSLYLINQKDMFDPPNCNPRCDSIKNLVTRQYSCENSNCSEEDKCRGHISHCTDVFQNIQVCKPNPVGMFTGYQQIGNIDKKKPCDREIKMTTAKDSNAHECPVCLCTCTEDDYMSYSNRIVSFREQVSDIQNNRIITNIALMVTYNVTYIEIEQSRIKLEGNAERDQHQRDSGNDLVLNWAETLENKRVVYYTQSDEGLKRLEERKDYGILSADENIFNLDDIVLPTNYVVTGVRFNYKKVDTGPSPIQLEVRATLYDYLTGNLITGEENPSIWLTSEDMKGRLPDYDRKRREINVPLDTDARNTAGKCYFISDPNYFVSVKASTRKVNLGRLTQPLMYAGFAASDEQLFALGGVGLSYKAKNANTAGFLFLRMYEFDWTSSLQFPNVEDQYDDIDDDDDDEDENENDNEKGAEDDDEDK